jgi:hypothetical protein
MMFDFVGGFMLYAFVLYYFCSFILLMLLCFPSFFVGWVVGWCGAEFPGLCYLIVSERNQSLLLFGHKVRG